MTKFDAIRRVGIILSRLRNAHGVMSQDGAQEIVEFDRDLGRLEEQYADMVDEYMSKKLQHNLFKRRVS